MGIQPTSPVLTQQIASNQAAPPARQSTTASTATDTQEASATDPVRKARDAEPAQAQNEATNKPALDPEALREMVARAQSALQPKARDIMFSMNEVADAVVIKIIDRESEEVIRQIPSEEFLKIAEALSDQIETIRTGLLLEHKA